MFIYGVGLYCYSIDPCSYLFGLEKAQTPGLFLGFLGHGESVEFPFLLNILLLIRFLGSIFKVRFSDHAAFLF